MIVKPEKPCVHSWGPVHLVSIQKCVKCGTVERVKKDLVTEIVKPAVVAE